MDFVIIICLIALLYMVGSYCKKENQHKLEPAYNINFGNEIMILGHKFIADEHSFYWDESKTYWFFQTSTLINYYGTFPNIFLSQDDFLKRLDALT